MRPRQERSFPPGLVARIAAKDAGGHVLAYVYFEDERAGRSAAKLLTRNEARRLTVNFPSCQRWYDHRKIQRVGLNESELGRSELRQ
jgi:hypothetical protein